MQHITFVPLEKGCRTALHEGMAAKVVVMEGLVLEMNFLLFPDYFCYAC